MGINLPALAKAMRRVFQAVPFDERRDGLNKRVDTTDKNVRTDKKQDDRRTLVQCTRHCNGGKDDMGINSENSDGTGLLAKAMRRVFQEAVQEGAVPFDERRDGLNKRVDTTDKNVRTDKKQD